MFPGIRHIYFRNNVFSVNKYCVLGLSIGLIGTLSWGRSMRKIVHEHVDSYALWHYQHNVVR